MDAPSSVEDLCEAYLAGAALGDGCIEALGHGVDEVGGLCDLEGLPEIGFGGVGIGEKKIRTDGAREQIGLLGNDGGIAPQHLGFELTNVDAIEED